MTVHHARRLVRLHRKAEQHANEYKRLSGDPGTKLKALTHLHKVQRLFCQISDILRECNY